MIYLSYIACVLAVAGAIFAARKNSYCWIIWLISNALWSVYAFQTKQWAMLITELVFSIANTYGIIHWKKGKTNL